jgi:zinc transporter ZupT
MSLPIFFSLLLGLLLGLIHFFSENLKSEEGLKHYRIISFAAGISIAYLFLDLLPQTYEAAVHLKQFVFVFLLLGFAIFHLAEKLVYQHANQDKLAKELKEFHSISFFAYYFLIGIVLRDKIQISLLEGSLFMIPIALHAGLSTASLARIHGEIRESVFIKIALSLSTILGVIFAILIQIPTVLNNILISFIAGILLYIIVKEFLPEKKKGQPLFFIIGLALFFVFYVVIILARK